MAAEEHLLGELQGLQDTDLAVVYAPKNIPAADASTGEQKALLIGLVLAHASLIAEMTGFAPVLLLDEVAGGLTETECRSLVDLVREVKAAGVTIVWIEHIVHALLAVVDRLVVLHGGALIADGEPQAVIRSPRVEEIYMGIAAHA